MRNLPVRACTTPLVVNEYSRSRNKTTFPNWINIIVPEKVISNNFPSLSETDVSLLSLALDKKAMIRTDDKVLRQAAKNLKIHVVGTLGILRFFYKNGWIKSRLAYK